MGLSEADAAKKIQAAARGCAQRQLLLLSKAEPRKHIVHGRCSSTMHRMQENAVPLLLGICVALIWVNVDPDSYGKVLGTRSDTIRLWPGAELFGHPITIRASPGFQSRRVYRVATAVHTRRSVVRRRDPTGAPSNPVPRRGYQITS